MTIEEQLPKLHEFNKLLDSMAGELSDKIEGLEEKAAALDREPEIDDEETRSSTQDASFNVDALFSDL
jgi:hypothetical protein